MSIKKGKVTLISVDEYGPSMGLRFLSAVLKRAGYDTTVIFAFGTVTREIAMGKSQAFSEKVHRQISKLAEGSLYIGISLVTSTYHKAREITEHLKSRLDVPVIWGGVHAIVKPEECLQKADMVCFGEGENLVVALAERLGENKHYDDIPGLLLPEQPHNWRLQLTDITDLPKPDYDFSGNHYIATPQRIESFRVHYYRQFLYIDYNLAPTRGCPYRCTYCVNNQYYKLNKKVIRFRKRNLENVMDELIWAKNNIPDIRRIMIDDDCFMAVKEDEIRYFAGQYKKHIKLPFVVRGAHPQTTTEEKLKLLCDAGMIKLRIGIQTGSQETRRLYGRLWESNEKILSIAKIVNKFIEKRQLQYINYDVITDNPWETVEDQRKTLDLVLSLPQPFWINSFSLTFYPGTELYQRALSEGIIKDDCLSEAYWKQFFGINPTPTNQILNIMTHFPLPAGFMRFLVDTGTPSLKGPVTAMIRNGLLKIFTLLPELSLFFTSRLRYEIDFLVKYDKKLARDYVPKIIKKMEIHKSVRVERKNSSLLKMFKRVLLSIYFFRVRLK